ncbi:MAG: transcriptional regulator, partial [Oscillospiraceae bacterium]|nr:transcriptional regulator [Oscillospiraceae bacterium]
FLLEKPRGKDTQRRQLDALLDSMSAPGVQIVTATAKEIVEIEQAQSNGQEDA